MKITRIITKNPLPASSKKPNIFYRLNFNTAAHSSHFDSEAYESEQEARQTNSLRAYPDFIIIEVDPN